MSGFGVKAEVLAYPSERLSLAKSNHQALRFGIGDLEN
jgi:hypothetical protein